MPLQKSEGGGSLLLAWQVRGRNCLVVGGGEVAAGRINLLLVADARVTVVAPSINEEIQNYQDTGRLRAIHMREYKPSDLTMYESKRDDLIESFQSLQISEGKEIDQSRFEEIETYIKDEKFAIVCVAIDDPKLSKVIYYQAKLNNLQVNIADKPPLCDFYFGAMYRNGPLQIMVSTNGKSPRLAKTIKDRVKETFKDVKVDKSVENLGKLRAQLRIKVPEEDLETIATRMDWIKNVTDSYSLEDWSEDLSNTVIENLLSYYPQYPPKNTELKDF